MHSYVDKLFKEVNNSKILERTVVKGDTAILADNLELINEIGSENEHSYSEQQFEISPQSMKISLNDTNIRYKRLNFASNEKPIHH